MGVFLNEHHRPGWRTLLRNVVAIETDFANRHGLPGFLSESYTGHDTQYTGSVGIPELAVSPRPRITTAASLYTLGSAYSVAPDETEQFLAKHWPIIATLLTDHGPWEGYNIETKSVIPFQTTAHTLALALGLIGTGTDHMTRYLTHHGLANHLDAAFPVATNTHHDLMTRDVNVVAWSADNERGITSERLADGSFHIRGDSLKHFGIAVVSTRAEGVNLSGGLLRLRYRTKADLDHAIIDLKPAPSPRDPYLIPRQVFTRLEPGDARELQIPLPATPGLSAIKEIVLTHETRDPGPVEVTITGVELLPSPK